MSSVSYVSLHRPSRYVGSLGKFGVLVDGQEVGKVANGQREQFEVSPGQHQLAVKIGFQKTKPASFTVAPGETASFTLGSVSAVAQMVLSLYYLLNGKNYWLIQEKA